MKCEVVSDNRRKNQRVQSSLMLLLEACRHWAKSFDNPKLLSQISDMKYVLNHLDLEGCSDDSVNELESVTMTLITNMDQFLKSMGQEGIEFNLVKH